MTKTMIVHQIVICQEYLMIYLQKTKILVKTIPEHIEFCLCHQSSTLRYALKGGVAEGDSTPWKKQ